MALSCSGGVALTPPTREEGGEGQAGAARILRWHPQSQALISANDPGWAPHPAALLQEWRMDGGLRVGTPGQGLLCQGPLFLKGCLSPAWWPGAAEDTPRPLAQSPPALP